MARYSLARYILTLTLPADFDATFTAAFGSVVSIGGEGSMMNNIKVTQNNNLWETEGDVTGGYVHNQNLDRTGTCEVTIKQVSEAVAKFIRLCNCFYTSDLPYSKGVYIQVKDNEGNVVATCEDCFIQKPADQEFADKAGDQSWIFTCGKVVFNSLA